MAEGNRKMVAVLILVVILFAAGMGLGYYFWGSGRKSVDYKQYLQETINYISTMEKKNEDLSAKVTGLEAEVNTLKQRGQESAGSNAGVISSLDQQVQALRTENQRLNAVIGNIQALVQNDPSLKQRIDAVIQGANTAASPGGSTQGVSPAGQGQP